MRAGLFAVPLGVPFARGLVQGLWDDTATLPPEALARTRLLVNAARTRTQIMAEFNSGPARLLPQTLTVEQLPDLVGLPPERAAMARRLDLAHLLQGASMAQPGFAPVENRFALAGSLAELLDEMEGEGVTPETVAALRPAEISEHWADTQAFIGIAGEYLNSLGGVSGKAGRLRRAVDRLRATLDQTPLTEPLILAGSTGSRGAVLDLMAAILAQAKGIVVLPGFDTALRPQDWAAIANTPNWEDHPQSRAVALARRLGFAPEELPERVGLWVPAQTNKVAARAGLLTLALTPAPATDHWRAAGPHLADLDAALEDVTLLESPGPREEAGAIALGIRAALDKGESALLITPDGSLARRVTAALSRWDIVPDVSSGMPLGLSAMGRLARHVAALARGPADLAEMLALLKHPLTASLHGRGAHNHATRALELSLRGRGPDVPEIAALRRWAEKEGRGGWIEWVIACVLTPLGPQSDLGAWAAAHRQRLAMLARAPEGRMDGAPEGPATAALWRSEDGQGVDALLAEMEEAARLSPEAAAMIGARDYTTFFEREIATHEVRRGGRQRPDVQIWGGREARVAEADLVILAGLSDGVWPEYAPPDPWLNRELRREAGLPSPERRIGLQAHDFQQGAVAPKVWLCRQLRDDEAETVASRWVLRLTGLLNGLAETGGRAALKAAQKRGAVWLERAKLMEAPIPSDKARRPCPAPPHAMRPKRLSVTELKTLKRDPYAIYARHVLRLSPLSPLKPEPDARVRGIVLHKVMEDALKRGLPEEAGRLVAELRDIAGEVIGQEVAWPVARLLWQARLARFAPSFAAHELARPRAARRLLEQKGEIIGPLGVTLVGKADRIDLDGLGQAWLMDYKTGAPPGPKDRERFDPQMPVLAEMLRRGAFPGAGNREVAGMSYITLDVGAKESVVKLSEAEDVWPKLEACLSAMLDEARGFAARPAHPEAQAADYDHLARRGEWDMTDPALREVME